MLNNDERNFTAAHSVHRGFVLRCQRIGRVNEYDIGTHATQINPRRAVNYTGAGFSLKHGEIAFDESGCLAIFFDEDHLACAAADRFDADGPGARVGVYKDHPLDGVAEDVKERLAHLVRRGAHVDTRQRLQNS